jgi:hypothetical protein
MKKTIGFVWSILGTVFLLTTLDSGWAAGHGSKLDRKAIFLAGMKHR